MNKQDFTNTLAYKLSVLPSNEVEERINFYSEMIDDRIEEGLTEEEAVSELGAIDDIVAQIMSEKPLSKLVLERVKPKRKLSTLEIVLLVLGSPIWLSLIIATISIILSLYIVIWSFAITLWVVELALAASTISGIVSSIAYIIKGSSMEGFTLLGFGLMCAGLTIFMDYGCDRIVKNILLLSKKIFTSIKSFFIKKEVLS